jgi:hypothetical protein
VDSRGCGRKWKPDMGYCSSVVLKGIRENVKYLDTA